MEGKLQCHSFLTLLEHKFASLKVQNLNIYMLGANCIQQNPWKRSHIDITRYFWKWVKERESPSPSLTAMEIRRFGVCKQKHMWGCGYHTSKKGLRGNTYVKWRLLAFPSPLLPVLYLLHKSQENSSGESDWPKWKQWKVPIWGFSVYSYTDY